MHKLLLASVSAAALIASPVLVTPATAGGPFFPLFECVYGGLYSGTYQVQCAENYIADPGYHKSNDHNEQEIEQEQEAELNYVPNGTIQLQVGANVVWKGDHNEQSIEQEQEYENESSWGGLAQLQVGVNVVEDGSHNEQSIEQEQELEIEYSNF